MIEIQLKNQFDQDHSLQNYLKRIVPADLHRDFFEQLQVVGQDAVGCLQEWANEAERNNPKHIAFDAWGNRKDEIQTSEGWKNLEKYAATHGIVATAYERKYQEFSRVLQMSLLYLYHPSSAICSCPMAMTDGAARCLEVYGDTDTRGKALQHLTSRDPKTFWTSGQWMTEKSGGSDVGTTETIAKKTGDHYSLWGEKWFTSAATSQMAMTLARLEGAPSGSKGLSLFYLETRDDNQAPNNFQVVRLKDKLGTKALPTAELLLQGTRARLIGGEGHGVKKIATLFNVTRVYNAVCAVGYMRRALALAEEFSRQRKAFGKYLIEHPLHQQTLLELQTEFEDCLKLVLDVALLMGKEETNRATQDEIALLRLLTTLAKLYTGQATWKICSEVMEIFGGVGYCEDSGIPVILRNAHVLSIWEGTTNILSLDTLRALSKECPFEVFEAAVRNNKNANEIDALKQNIKQWSAQPELLQRNARSISLQMARLYMRRHL